MLNAVIVIIPSIYCILVLYTTYRWVNLARHSASQTHSKNAFTGFSILVAVRNEEENLPALLESIQQLDYPGDCFEVLVINDHSQDDTVNIAKNYPNVKVLDLKKSSGKKAAIEMGVDNACYEWVAITDGDCIVPRDWLAAFNQQVDQKTQLMFGPLELRGNGPGHEFQAFEQAALMTIGAIAISEGKPIMMNAANMVFRKSSFNEVGGYAENRQTASGDDQFLMSAINTHYPGGIKFIKSQKLIVGALSAATLSQFVNQRIRWASKWKKQSNPIVALGVWAFYLAFVAVITIVLVEGMWLLLPFFLLKWVADYILVYSVFRFLNTKISIGSFIIGQILYPVYAILIGILANLVPYSWKGRTIRVNE